MAFPYKHVLLVGATAGIGAAMADKLIQGGVKVVAVGRRQDRLDAFIAKHDPANAAAIKYDVTDKSGLDDFVNFVKTKYPDLDCVFLNSGIQTPIRLSSPETVDLESFHTELNTNFTSVVDLTVKFLPHLLAKPSPTSVIITGTQLALVPAATIPAYSASKAALHAFTACLRHQLTGTNTKVIEIWPPAVQTELHDYMGETQGRQLGMPLDLFTEQAYPQLAAGSENVFVGSIGPGDSFKRLFEAHEEMTNNFARLLLLHSKP